MKVVILYRPVSEHGSSVEAFARDFGSKYHTDTIELLDVDSPNGSSLAQLYDIMQYPTILALREDGTLLHSWEGSALPLLDEVAYYTMQ